MPASTANGLLAPVVLDEVVLEKVAVGNVRPRCFLARSCSAVAPLRSPPLRQECRASLPGRKNHHAIQHSCALGTHGSAAFKFYVLQRSRTPGWSPLVNSIPAASNAPRSAAIVGACATSIPGLASRRLTVARETEDASDRCRCSQRSRLRAARTNSLVRIIFWAKLGLEDLYESLGIDIRDA